MGYIHFFIIILEYYFFRTYKLPRNKKFQLSLYREGIKKMSIIKNYLKQNKVTHTFSDCQWPIGDPQEKDFHFCEAETLTGKPYCKEHCDVAYIDERELKKEKEAQKNRRIAA